MALKIIAKICLVFLFCLTGCNRYDAKNPDVPGNRTGFKNMTKIAPEEGVKNVYFYSGAFLIFDPYYCMAFETTPKIVTQIVRNLKMLQQENTRWKSPLKDINWLFWWDAEERRNSIFYNAEVYNDGMIDIAYYLWHDPKTGKCQFMKICF